MRKQVVLAAAVGLFLGTGSARAQSTVAPADSDSNVTVQCPAANAGTPVRVEGEVSSPTGDHTDVINYTLEVPPKSPQNTGLWQLKGSVQCTAGSQARFTLPGGRTENSCSTGNRQVFDMTINPNSTRTGRITVQASPGPGNQGAYARYTFTLYCGIYRAN